MKQKLFIIPGYYFWLLSLVYYNRNNYNKYHWNYDISL